MLVCHFLYWAGFKYGLSALRTVLTILSCLLLGYWGVIEANSNDYLVIDAEYSATMLPSGENSSPTFVQPLAEYVAITPACNDLIDPFMYAADLFFPLIDFRQEFRCHIRNAVEGEEALKFSELAAKTNWSERYTYLKTNLTNHPQPWIWLKGLYTLLGWIIVSLSIVTITRLIRYHVGDNVEQR